MGGLEFGTYSEETTLKVSIDRTHSPLYSFGADGLIVFRPPYVISYMPPLLEHNGPQLLQNLNIGGDFKEWSVLEDRRTLRGG